MTSYTFLAYVTEVESMRSVLLVESSELIVISTSSVELKTQVCVPQFVSVTPFMFYPNKFSSTDWVMPGDIVT